MTTSPEGSPRSNRTGNLEGKLSPSASTSSSSLPISTNDNLIPFSGVNGANRESEDIESHPIALTRTRSNVESIQEQDRLSRILSGVTTRSNKDYLNKPLPEMGGGRELPPKLPEQDIYTVDFTGADDPYHPHNWPLGKKLKACVALGFLTLCSAWASGVYSSAVPFVSEEFNVALIVGTLGVSFYVLGFASGPTIWAPLSELYGRKPVLVIASFIFTVFQFAVAVAKDLQTILICRFFGGFFGAAPIVVVAAAFSDMFGNQTRGIAISIFSACVFVGPNLAPIAGSFISYSYLGWRWTEYITGIMGAAAVVLVVMLYPESYHPIILCDKAEELRRRTGVWGIRAKHESFRLSIKEIVNTNLTRPVRMLFTEPIIFLITIYNAFIYGILYLFLTAYPYVYAYKYHWTGGLTDMVFIPLAIGQILGGLGCVWSETNYNKVISANGGKPVPEARLPPMMVGCFLFPIGLMWFMWTGNYPDKVHWVVPMVSGIFTGAGLITIFLPSMNYIVDSYLMFAASALAANTMLRSFCGSIFPLFATFMLDGMGVNWAGLLLGLLGFILCPVPFLFYKYGKRIRRRSKFAPDL